jgi:hypothetical protein
MALDTQSSKEMLILNWTGEAITMQKIYSFDLAIA